MRVNQSVNQFGLLTCGQCICVISLCIVSEQCDSR